MRKFAKSQIVDVLIVPFDNSEQTCEFVGMITEVHAGEHADFEYTIKPIKILHDDMGFLLGCGGQVLIQEREISYKEPSNLLKGIL